MTIHRGTIAGMRGNWSSGIAWLDFTNGISVPCENAPTVRALNGCFGNAIGPGHTINQQGIIGKEIVYWLDDMGLILEGFADAVEWDEKDGREIPIGGLEIE